MACKLSSCPLFIFLRKGTEFASQEGFFLDPITSFYADDGVRSAHLLPLNSIWVRAGMGSFMLRSGGRIYRSCSRYRTFPGRTPDKYLLDIVISDGHGLQRENQTVLFIS